ncbi:hypothetical protein G9C98_005675 [Cotesia typhae]|uniref:Protein croquemort n=1 Tax=Cotesia typhae TaxID=2053667 RepID=A0A8J5QYU8_9HYME|nr:hypothetical protein G9C98_005675 [Cotesia typhae]
MKTEYQDESMDFVLMHEYETETEASEKLLTLSSKMSDNNYENNSNQETVDKKHKDNDIVNKTNGVQSRPQPEKMAPSKMKLGIIFGVAFVSICAGITVGVLWNSIIDKILVKELALTPTSQKYAMWKETPIPVYLKVYLFNWTNPQDFSVNSKVKPHFNELGPYVFKEVDYKVNQVWNDNDTITFQQKRLFALLAANSVLKLLNESQTITKTVRELLFDGYDDKLLELVNNVTKDLPFSKFGWFYNRNNSETYDGTFNMLTGATGLWGTGILQEWNYSDKSKNFKKECGFINGSLGDAWPTVAENSSVNIFAPDVCTLLNLNFSEEEDHEGLIGKKYVSTSMMLDNGTKVPSRACYCQGIECQPSGTLNVSSCKFGAPAFISLPHFYLADPSYLDAIDGLSPSRNEHEFSMLVEPQEANLTADYAKQVKFIATLPLLGHVTFYGIACIGILLIFVGIGIYIKKFRNSDDNQRLIPKTDVNSTMANS